MPVKKIKSVDLSAGGLITRMMSSTFLADRSRLSGLGDYGVLKPGILNKKRKLIQPKKFGIDDIKDRISDFINEVFTPETYFELLDYLADKMLSLEMRIFNGKAVNYIVDKITKQGVPAALVDSRLSRPGLSRMFGREVLIPVEKKELVKVTKEQMDAKILRSRAIAKMRVKEENGTPFADWEDAIFSSPMLFDGKEMTAQGKTLWVGEEFARASSSRDENLKIIEKARFMGVKLIVPCENKEDVKNGNFVAGMPILIKDKSVRSHLIDQTLSFDQMSKVIGKDLFEHYRATVSSSSPKFSGGEEAKVVDLTEFRKMKKKGKVGEVNKVGEKDFAKMFESFVVRHEMDANGKEIISMMDPDSGDIYPFDVKKMNPGTYRKEDAFGEHMGFLEVDHEGNMAHMNLKYEIHNDIGPSVVDGDGNVVSYALHGVEMNKSEFERRIKVNSGNDMGRIMQKFGKKESGRVDSDPTPSYEYKV